MHEKKVKEIKKAENFDLRDITTNARAKAISQTKKKKNSIFPGFTNSALWWYFK